MSVLYRALWSDGTETDQRAGCPLPASCQAALIAGPSGRGGPWRHLARHTRYGERVSPAHLGRDLSTNPKPASATDRISLGSGAKGRTHEHARLVEVAL